MPAETAFWGRLRARFLPRGTGGTAEEAGGDALLYAIGDIHGCARELQHLHHLIAADATRRQAGRAVYLVYVGDYVDRGPASADVIETLLAPPPVPGARRIFLRGNHEQAMLAFLADPEAGAEWLDYGGLATLQSYGVQPSGGGALWRHRLAEGLAERLPPAHRQFLEGLIDCWAYGPYGFVHAGVRPGRSWETQTAEDMLWIREPFLSSRSRFERRIVHGHTITDRPDVRPHRIGIDTGAFCTGVLTALVIDGPQEEFLQTPGSGAS